MDDNVNTAKSHGLFSFFQWHDIQRTALSKVATETIQAH